MLSFLAGEDDAAMTPDDFVTRLQTGERAAHDIIDRLEAYGLLRPRAGGPKINQANCVVLTERGLHALDLAAAAAADWYAQAMRDVPLGDIEVLESVLLQMRSNLLRAVVGGKMPRRDK